MQNVDSGFDLTIIVPVYNEEGNLDRLHGELLKFINDSPKKTRVLFINDGSRDGSLKKIKAICKDSESFTYCSFDRNYGLSAALKAGFDHSDTQLTGYIDADLQTTPEDFKMLLGYIDDYDLVQGVRQDRKDSFVKNASSAIANRIRRMFTHDGMDDTGCPLKIIRTDVAKKIPMFNGLHRFLPAMVLLQNGRILQVPVRHFPRIAGKSNFNLWKRLLGPLSDCFAYLWMKKKYINYKVEESGSKS
ncbi:MAG TPA: glycosyltransferase family 2 protein [Bacteroidales bacterium]|jgi:glycosyltransferase involved in cell wall biosynthesis|nr:glycosyltransferase family 2 protein [Bacteroidales bacterium]HQM70789.1 glycosyltransferase family 2 protein [Bacteroidales bacterium]